MAESRTYQHQSSQGSTVFLYPKQMYKQRFLCNFLYIILKKTFLGKNMIDYICKKGYNQLARCVLYLNKGE